MITNVKAVAVGGVPAVGKSTIFKRLIKMFGTPELVEKVYERPFVYKSGKRKGEKAVSIVKIRGLYFKHFNTMILGTYNEGELQGTDTVDRIVYQVLDRWLEDLSKEYKQLVLMFEGDRLFGQKGISIMKKHLSVVRMYMVVAPEDKIKYRHKLRGDNQTERFLKSLDTKNKNMCEYYPEIKFLPNIELVDIDRIAIRLFKLTHLLLNPKRKFKKKMIVKLKKKKTDIYFQQVKTVVRNGKKFKIKVPKPVMVVEKVKEMKVVPIKKKKKFRVRVKK